MERASPDARPPPPGRPGGRFDPEHPHLPVVLSLALRGRWDYGDSGVLDRTHLRFFTRATIEELFIRAGFRLETLEPINPFQRRGAFLVAGPFRDMRYLQFAVVARPT